MKSKSISPITKLLKKYGLSKKTGEWAQIGIRGGEIGKKWVYCYSSEGHYIVSREGSKTHAYIECTGYDHEKVFPIVKKAFEENSIEFKAYPGYIKVTL